MGVGGRLLLGRSPGREHKRVPAGRSGGVGGWGGRGWSRGEKWRRGGKWRCGWEQEESRTMCIESEPSMQLSSRRLSVATLDSVCSISSSSAMRTSTNGKHVSRMRFAEALRTEGANRGCEERVRTDGDESWRDRGREQRGCAPVVARRPAVGEADRLLPRTVPVNSRCEQTA